MTTVSESNRDKPDLLGFASEGAEEVDKIIAAVPELAESEGVLWRLVPFLTDQIAAEIEKIIANNDSETKMHPADALAQIMGDSRTLLRLLHFALDDMETDSEHLRETLPPLEDPEGQA